MTSNIEPLADEPCASSPMQRCLLLRLGQVRYFYSIAKVWLKYRKSVSVFISQSNQTFVWTNQAHVIVAFLVFSLLIDADAVQKILQPTSIPSLHLHHDEMLLPVKEETCGAYTYEDSFLLRYSDSENADDIPDASAAESGKHWFSIYVFVQMNIFKSY